MGALYSHTTRATGTTLTAAIYNGDHQNHIDNGTPQMHDDYSSNVAQMQATNSPGTVGAESLATSLAGELERLRHVIKTLHGGAQWYPGSLLAVAADTVAKSAYDAQGDILIAEAASTPVSLPFPSGGAHIINGKIARSVAGGALTVALKGMNDADPSATNPVLVMMPQGNPFDGSYAIRKVTAALSMVVSAGSTLGHADTIAGSVYIYLIDNAGTLELAVSNKFFGGTAVVTTTAEGGAGTADSASTMYSTTVRTNVPAAVLQRWKSTQTTAGTWDATTGEVQLFPFPHKVPTLQIFTSTGANTYTKPWDLLWAEVRVQAAGGGGGGADVTTGQSTGGGSGGGGEYREGIILAETIAPTETATVGAGGAGGNASGSNGATGGTSSFGAHISCTGGTFGAGSTTDGASGAPGNGGAGGSGGDIVHQGSDADRNGAIGGGGGGQVGRSGGSHFGGARRGTNVDAAGVAGRLYGGGGTGGEDAPGAAGAGNGQPGGAGAQGIIIVTEHYI